MSKYKNDPRVDGAGSYSVIVTTPAGPVEVLSESRYNAWRIVRPGHWIDEFRQTEDEAIAFALGEGR